MPSGFTSNYKSLIAKEVDCGLVRASVALDGYCNQIRHNPNASAELIILIPVIAKQYGARFDIDKETILECVEFVKDKFSFLSVREIKEAYRQFASGEFKDASGKMYGGEFNLSNFGAVLTGYNLNRKKIIAKHLQKEGAKKLIAIENEKKERQKREYEEGFEELIRTQSRKINSWADVPVHWYDTAKRKNLIRIGKEEAMHIFTEAKKIAMTDADSNFSGCDVLAGNQTYHERSRRIARKITVFRKLILPLK